jgi:hypothetical protein
VIGSGKTDLARQVIISYTKENEHLVDQLLSIQYYFRGAITRDDVWMMSPSERDAAVVFINKRFTDAAEMIKNRIPVFI